MTVLTGGRALAGRRSLSCPPAAPIPVTERPHLGLLRLALALPCLLPACEAPSSWCCPCLLTALLRQLDPCRLHARLRHLSRDPGALKDAGNQHPGTRMAVLPPVAPRDTGRSLPSLRRPTGAEGCPGLESRGSKHPREHWPRPGGDCPTPGTRSSAELRERGPGRPVPSTVEATLAPS